MQSQGKIFHELGHAAAEGPHTRSFAETVLADAFGPTKKVMFPDIVESEVTAASKQPDACRFGALLDSYSRSFDISTDEILKATRPKLCYVEIDDKVFDLGPEILYRDEDLTANRCTAEQKEMAATRFDLAKPLAVDDPIGIDFYVSYVPRKESAPVSWVALGLLSELFEERYERLPRFWIEPISTPRPSKPPTGTSRPTQAFLDMSVLPTMSYCSTTLFLQSQYSCGAHTPPTLPDVRTCLELFAAMSFGILDKYLYRILWLPLFSDRSLPPKVELVQGNVAAFGGESEKEELLRKLHGFPTDIQTIEDTINRNWSKIYHEYRAEYQRWDELRRMCEMGKKGKIETLLAKGTIVDLPSVDEMQPLAAAVKHTLFTGQNRELISALLAAGADPLSGISFREFGLAEPTEDVFRILDELLEPSFPVIDLVRQRFTERGAWIMTEYFKSRAVRRSGIKLKSLCGLEVGETELNLRQKFAASMTLTFVGLSRAIRNLDLSENSEIMGTLDRLSPLQELEHLRICGSPIFQIKLTGTFEPLSAFTNLQTLDLRECNRISGTLEALRPLARLVTLNLNKCFQTVGRFSDLGGMTRLRFLDLGQCRHVGGSLDELLPCTEMERLNLELCDFESTPSFLQRFQRLSELNISGIYKVTDEEPNKEVGFAGTLKPVVRCKQLSKFNVTGCLLLEGDIVYFTKCPMIMILILDGCYQLEGFVEKLNQLDCLSELNLRGCYKIQGDLRGLESLNVLRKMNIEGCPQIDFVEEFKELRPDVRMAGHKPKQTTLDFESSNLQEIQEELASLQSGNSTALSLGLPE